MAITRTQKEHIVEAGKQNVRASRVMVFADYKGLAVSDMSALRSALKEVNARMRVIKKRLLKIILAESGIKFDPTELEGQVAAVFAEGDIYEVAGPLYRFSKEHGTFEILGGVDVEGKKEIPRETIIAIGTLPTRDVLLAQVVGSIAAPLRGIMYVLSEASKK